MLKASVRHASILVVAATLAGCAHAVDLVPLDGGSPGIGDVGYKGKDMSVRLDGRLYKGAFVPASSPEIAKALTPGAYDAVPTGRRWGLRGSVGPTAAVLTSKDGATLTCRFSYDRSDLIGSGLCRDPSGRNFALRMR